MSRLRAWAWRAAGLLRLGRGDGELSEEIQTHLEMDAAERQRAGLAPDEARRQAVLAFGAVESIKDQYRDQRSLPLAESSLQDVRYAVRGFRRNPGFTAAALLVLALGIGANAAIFTVVNGVLLRPLPYRDPDRLVMIWHVPPSASFPGVKEFAVSAANFLDWQRQQHTFERMAVGQYRVYTLTGRGQAEQLQASGVSEDFFATLGVRPAAGRWFLPEENVPGHDQVVILSYGLWQSHFGADPGLVGHSILLDGQGRTVVGVAPKDFAFPSSAQLWTPLAWTPEQRAVRSNHNAYVVSRLAPGVAIERAQAEMSAISNALQQQYPADDKGWGAVVKPLRDDLVGDLRPSLLVLLGAVGFVLLIACANVANLVLVRTLARRRELSLRLALGAGAARIVRQVLTETTLLALSGGALGLLVAGPGVSVITSYFGDRLPPSMPVRADGRVLAFTLFVALATGLAAGLAPALRLARGNPADGIRQGGRSESERGGTGLRRLLVLVEVALSLILLVGAGLMIRSLSSLNRVDAGLDPEGVLTASLALTETRYPTADDQARFIDRAIERVKALPGVESAGFVTNLPLGNGGNQWPVAIQGRPELPLSEQPQLQGNVVTPEYFRALRIPIVKGRPLTASDRPGRPNVLLVSEAAARWLWPGQDPLRQQLRIGFFPEKTWEIVGVVKDVKERALAKEGTASMYLPVAQLPEPYGTLVVRTRTSQPAALASALVAAVRELDPDLPLVDVMPMTSVVARSMVDLRTTMILLAAFAGLALLLAAVGIYSVIAYAVRRRTREIGIRMALGASGRGVIRMVIVDALGPTLAGVAVGLAGALAIRGVMASLVYGVSAGDPATFVAVSVLLLAVAVAASAVPAYRATRVSPTVALRDD